MTLLDAPALSQRALAAVDDAIRAATAPDGLLDQLIGESIASAVDPDGLLDQRIGESIASVVSSAVTSTLDEIFVSYQTCVLEERHAAEADLTSSLHAARKSAERDFQAVTLTCNDGALRPGQKLVTSSSDFTPASIVASPLPPPQPPPDSSLFHPTVCFHPTVETETGFHFHPSTNATPPSCLRAAAPDTSIDTAIISTVNEPVLTTCPTRPHQSRIRHTIETHPDVFLCPQRKTYWA
jgi:hypothetical protein